MLIPNYNYNTQLNYAQKVHNLNSIIIANEKIENFKLNLHIHETKKLKHKSIFNNGYILYSNGMIFSNYSNRWLKQYPYTNGKYLRKYFTTSLKVDSATKNKTFYLCRIMMYFYGEHNYETISDMPMIEYINENKTHHKFLDVTNLKFTTSKSIMHKKVLKYTVKTKTKIKNTPKNIEFITNQLNAGKTLNYIADLYGCSDMSVVRFKQRNNIEILRK